MHFVHKSSIFSIYLTLDIIYVAVAMNPNRKYPLLSWFKRILCHYDENLTMYSDDYRLALRMHFSNSFGFFLALFVGAVPIGRLLYTHFVIVNTKPFKGILYKIHRLE